MAGKKETLHLPSLNSWEGCGSLWNSIWSIMSSFGLPNTRNTLTQWSWGQRRATKMFKDLEHKMYKRMGELGLSPHGKEKAEERSYCCLQLLNGLHHDRTRGNKHIWFHIIFFPHWNGQTLECVLRRALNSPPLKMFKTELNKLLNNLI